MATRVSTLKAIFTAETGQAEAGFRRMRAQTDTFAQGAKGAFDGLGIGIAQFAGPAGVGLAVAGLAKGALAANALREQTVNTERQLIAYAGSAGAAGAATEAFIRATDNGVSRLDAMRMTGQLLGMGLANTAGEVERMARMAVLLGDKTLSVSERMANWNAMMANQSLPRLDTYGISSGRVRQRMDELTAANANLTREQAFTNAVLEIGGEKLAALEAQGVEAASSTDKVTAAWTDLKTAAAEAVNLRVILSGGADALREITEQVDLINARRAGATSANGLDAQMAGIQQQLEYLRAERQKWMESGAEFYVGDNQIEALETQLQNLQMYGAAADDVRAKLDAYLLAARYAAYAQDEYNTAVANGIPEQVANAQAEIEAANSARAVALAAYQAATATGEAAMAAAESGTAFEGAYPSADAYADALNRVAEAERRRNISGPGSGNAAWYGGGSGSFYGAQFESKNRDDLAYAREVRAERDRQRAEDERKQTDSARRVGQAYSKSLSDAARDFGDDMLSEMQEAQQASIGLLDVRPGGGDPNAPGQNGPFEDIFRLQAFISDGSWGDTAAKYGLDQAGARSAVEKFQSGMWDESVLKLIDMNGLKEQIKQMQAGKQLREALAADLAAETGGDASLISALLGLPAGGDGKGATVTGLDLSGFVPGFLAGVDKEIEASAEDLAKRGAALWDKLGGGFVKAASTSAAFKRAVTALVDEALASALE
jgi:hypothetical protein